MRTVVITGGTAGIGAGVARELLARGDRVVVVGRNPAKALPGADFVHADLSLVAAAHAAADEIIAKYPRIDALVLCARFFRSRRHETTKGFEDNFALFYLSRFVLAERLAGALSEADRPVIVNVAGPGAPLDVVNRHDLQFTRHYHPIDAMAQGGKLNDLHGVSFAERHPRIRYVLVHPGVTATSFAGEYDAASARQVDRMKRFGKPVGEAVAPIVRALDSPPAEPLSAFVEGRRIPVDGPAFDVQTARWLHAETLRLSGVSRETPARPG
ncbi:SDR family NAD(P)-dependent oxidoreductase [Amycolatopsis thermoflava]|uniref:SDR family NAD(P)-dependent oxidoreductase n=1 Tax=Amycolatopsis thermoflava TaxID=84480 RepID=UPI00365D8147